MIIVKKNFELDVKDIIDNFKITVDIGQNDSYYNQYKQQLITLNEDIVTKMCDVVKGELGDIEISVEYTRVNLVEEDSNKNDSYHTDMGYDLIFTYYPNDDYEGGEFVWYENSMVYEIKPTKNMLTIMLDNPKHKVRNVTSGKRYSIVTFCKIKRNIVKTLL